MAKIRKKSGDIFEIPLMPYQDLYVYAKYLNIKPYNPDAYYLDILLVYDFFVHQPVNFVSEIDKTNLFLNPIYIVGGDGLTKIFKIVGRADILENEIIIPPLRKTVPHDAYLRKLEVAGWKIVGPDENVLSENLLPLEAVCHIDPSDLIIGIDYLPFRINLELHKRNGTYPLDVTGFDFVQKNFYRHVAEMPLLRDVPPERRFKFPY